MTERSHRYQASCRLICCKHALRAPGAIRQLRNGACFFACFTAVAFSGCCRPRDGSHAALASNVAPTSSDGGYGTGEQTAMMSPVLLREVDEASIRPVSFHLRNLKRQEMTVELVEKSCGCQSLELPEQSVPAGDVAGVNMRINPPRKAEKKAYWATLALIWGTEKETVKVRTEFEVLAELLTAPTSIFHDFNSDEANDLAMTVSRRTRSEAEPEAIKPEFAELPEEVELVALEHVGMKVVWKEEGEQQRSEEIGSRIEDRDDFATETNGEPSVSIWEVEWHATLRLKVTDRVRQSPEGFVSQCVVACGDSEFSRVQIPIRMRCVEAIQASPSHTYFGSVRPNKERRRSVLLRSRDHEFEISEVTCDSPAFRAQTSTQEAKKLHTVQVGFGEAQSGKYTGMVRVKTTHPKCPEVRLTVEGVVEERGQVSAVGGQ